MTLQELAKLYLGCNRYSPSEFKDSPSPTFITQLYDELYDDNDSDSDNNGTGPHLDCVDLLTDQFLNRGHTRMA